MMSPWQRAIGRGAAALADDRRSGRAGARHISPGTVVPGDGWPIVRVDGPSLASIRATRFGQPFDVRFSDLMRTTAAAMLEQLGGVLGYTEGDEISILLRRGGDDPTRLVRAICATAVHVADAAFVATAGRPVHFVGRLWFAPTVDDVLAYFAWRQSDAARTALDGWCHWTLRTNGNTPTQATRRLRGARVSDKNELLLGHGIEFNAVPAWQRRGVLLGWEPIDHTAPTVPSAAMLPTARRRIVVDAELPMGEQFESLIATMLA
jgi:tRNA(His) 5'-end guanylyltransferase